MGSDAARTGNSTVMMRNFWQSCSTRGWNIAGLYGTGCKKDEANVAIPVLVEGDATTISDNVVQAMGLIHDALPHRHIRDGLEGLIITLIGRLNIPQQAVQIFRGGQARVPARRHWGGNMGEHAR